MSLSFRAVCYAALDNWHIRPAMCKARLHCPHPTFLKYLKIPNS